ncbi:sulfurtransferase [Paraliobacillus quinghaiensis]|uniref:Sulfurtransferase n=1 Tax=Paraliobacillus quinghaiensis TaxID=470815 RepID=A0A917TDA0_9BACI|nr:rhodanese-like domain-containing protein [Paraliobacillus quinghaiensis]GGM19328.1 sulfurtransferase [Paraliobacillus quinghaiensis]
MEYTLYIAVIFLTYIMIKRMVPTKGVQTISTAKLKNELKDKKKQFIDVRTPNEFKGNKIKEFKNVPLHQLKQKAEKEINKEKEVVVICQSGMRSQQACKQLKKLGYDQVTNVKGGMNAWR